MTETPERPEAILRFRADQLREAYDRGEAISPNDARLIEVAIRGVADGPPITRDDDYVREVQAVSELLMDFDPTDRFASISEHLADLLKRFAASRSAFSGIPRTENDPTTGGRAPRGVAECLATWDGWICNREHGHPGYHIAHAGEQPMRSWPASVISSASPLSEEERSFVEEVRGYRATNDTLGWESRLVEIIDRLSASAPSPEDKGSDNAKE